MPPPACVAVNGDQKSAYSIAIALVVHLDLCLSIRVYVTPGKFISIAMLRMNSKPYISTDFLIDHQKCESVHTLMSEKHKTRLVGVDCFTLQTGDMLQSSGWLSDRPSASVYQQFPRPHDETCVKSDHVSYSAHIRGNLPAPGPDGQKRPQHFPIFQAQRRTSRMVGRC